MGKRTTRSHKTFLLIASILLLIFICIQFIRPEIKNPPVTADLQAPVPVKAIFQRACYDCHSNETNLHWFDKISPVYWRVAKHVETGREVLNFSSFNNLAPADQKGKLWEAFNQIALGAMPLKDYQFVHTSAKISAADLAILKKYLTEMAVKQKPEDTAKINALNKQSALLQSSAGASPLPTAPNGVTYIPDYKNWQPISTTERFDNGTMRVIFGNDIAVKAIKENHINPWPNGTIFAKVAWDQLAGKDGNIKTGAFKQIEYMIKDNKKYAATAGWGWARFKTPKMIPYGKNAMFTTECVNCHKPVANQDFVFTPPIKF
ncbi:cytochrome P460 [Pedobacter sp. HMWF019]|uniref:heme-binding domain-containing protein n=1 Tax=Pedobacter sp. HMWF019 TaxID=2056856 RepID=UPI000D388B3E|nr:heme-binding domain-containing protein [Pedobacter sp. HMWF019]PTS97361.1 cytochrome P460 [Pedobacter sp. HMWF019]